MSSIARRVCLGFGSICALALGAGAGIGLVIVNGSFQIDHATLRGSATLFEGNLIETSTASSQLHLNSGASLRLAAESRAKVYTARLVLEKGGGQIESPKYTIEAATLHIETGGTTRVQLAAPDRVIVAVRDGAAQVSNSTGVLIARLAAGREMMFQPQQASDAALTKVSGILAVKDGRFIVVDRTTNVTIQVQGPDLEAEVGNLVEITGTVNAEIPTVAGTSQLVDVTGIKRLTKKTVAAAAGGAAAGTGAAAAGAAAAGGLSTAGTVAIVGGVAAAGTVGGLAAEHDLPGQGNNTPSASR